MHPLKNRACAKWNLNEAVSLLTGSTRRLCVAAAKAGLFSLCLVGVFAEGVPTVTVTKVGEWPGFGRGFPWHIEVVGTLAYVAVGPGGLAIFDVSNPASPVGIGGYDTEGGEARWVQVVGNLADVADWDNGLQIVDVSNPATPVWVGEYDTLGFARDVEVVGDLVYVADGTHGIQILRVSMSLTLNTPRIQDSDLVLTWVNGTAPFTVELRETIDGEPTVLGVTDERTFTVPLTGDAGFLQIRSEKE